MLVDRVKELVKDELQNLGVSVIDVDINSLYVDTKTNLAHILATAYTPTKAYDISVVYNISDDYLENFDIMGVSYE